MLHHSIRPFVKTAKAKIPGIKLERTIDSETQNMRTLSLTFQTNFGRVTVWENGGVLMHDQTPGTRQQEPGHYIPPTGYPVGNTGYPVEKI